MAPARETRRTARCNRCGASTVRGFVACLACCRIRGFEGAETHHPIASAAAAALNFQADLIHYRDVSGKTQTQIGELLSVDQTSVSRMMTAKRPKLPPPAIILRFAAMLHKPIERYGMSNDDFGSDDFGVHVISSARAARRSRVSGQLDEATNLINAGHVSLHIGSEDTHRLSILAAIELRLALALLQADRGQISTSLNHLDAAFTALGGRVSDARSAYIAAQLGNQLRMAGKYRGAAQYLSMSLTHKQDLHHIAATSPLLARVEGHLGNRRNFERSIVRAKNALEKVHGGSGIVSEYALAEFEVRGYLELGDLQQARRTLDSVSRASDLLATRHWRIIFAITQAELLARERDPAAVTELQAAATAAQTLGLPNQLERVKRVASLLVQPLKTDFLDYLDGLTALRNIPAWQESKTIKPPGTVPP